MAIIEWPSKVIPNAMSINLVHNSIGFTSPYNQSMMTHKLPGARWRASLSFNTLDDFNGVDEISRLQAFLWSLEGINGRFLMWDFTKPGMPEKGSPVVNGPNQYGGLLNTRGWRPNSLVIPAGRYFSINNELKFATKDLYSNSLGICTLEFTPWIRIPPADGDVITTDKPKGMFRLVDNDQGNFNLTPGLEASITIEVVEAFHV